MRYIGIGILIIAVCSLSGCRRKHIEPVNPKLEELGKESVRLNNAKADFLEAMTQPMDQKELGKARNHLEIMKVERAKHDEKLAQLSEEERKYMRKFDAENQQATARMQKAMDIIAENDRGQKHGTGQPVNNGLGVHNPK